jgi:SAM-dependent methyltransferase
MKGNNTKKEFLDKQVMAFSGGGDNNNILLERHKIIINFITKFSKKDDNILDVGCFDGKILKLLERDGFKNLYGVDFSDASKKSFKNTSIHFAPCDIEKDEIPFDRKFDVVIFTDILEHLFSPQSTLYDLRKKLNKDAKIIFSVPNAGWVVNGILLSFFPSKLFISTAFGQWGHTYHFTFFQVRKIAGNLKFKIIKLSGGKNENNVFKKGLKKIIFDLFLFLTYPLVLAYPQIFSDHIFGVFQNTESTLLDKDRFELGN